jgi:hypothetical protein
VKAEAGTSAIIGRARVALVGVSVGVEATG